jgi:hypothetical protein
MTVSERSGVSSPPPGLARDRRDGSPPATAAINTRRTRRGMSSVDPGRAAPVLVFSGYRRLSPEVARDHSEPRFGIPRVWGVEPWIELRLCEEDPFSTADPVRALSCVRPHRM